MSSTSARLPYADDSVAEADPREAMLGLIEHAIETGLAADLGVQMEARVLRLFPSLVRAAEAQPAPAAPTASLSIDERLALAGELAGLRSIRARRLTDIERAAVDAATARVHAALGFGATDSRPRSRSDDRGAGTTEPTTTSQHGGRSDRPAHPAPAGRRTDPGACANDTEPAML